MADSKAKTSVEPSSKAMLAKANQEKRTIKFSDRVKLEIIKDTKYYRVGQEINPHRLVAEQLIESKIAKELK